MRGGVRSGTHVFGVYSHAGSPVHYRTHLKSNGGFLTMPILSVIATTIAQIAEGAVLAASVYLVNRGVKHSTRNRKK